MYAMIRDYIHMAVISRGCDFNICADSTIAPDALVPSLEMVMESRFVSVVGGILSHLALTYKWR